MMWISKHRFRMPLVGGDLTFKLITTARPRAMREWRRWRNRDDAHYRVDMKRALGLFNSAHNTIVIDVSLPLDSIDHTIRHELGHALGQRIAAGADWTSDAFANGVAVALRDYERHIRALRRLAFGLARTIQRPWVRAG